MSFANTWAVRPAAASTAFIRVAAAHAANAVFVLLKTDFSTAGAINGAGYMVSFTTSADITANATAWIIVGVKVGQTSGATTTETVTGPNSATTVFSTNFYTRIDSITATGTAGGSSGAVTVAVGYGGSLAIPRCRIQGVHFVAAATAGSVVVNMNTTSGTEVVGIDTPAVASAAFSQYVRTGNILVGRSSQVSDFGIVTLTTVTKVTLFLE